MKDSKEPGAKALFDVLAERGLTSAVIANQRTLIKSAREAIPDDDEPVASKPEDVAKGREEQLAALAQLRLCMKDWATTFRDVFGVRAHIKLGLTRLKRGKNGEEEAEDGLAEAQAGESRLILSPAGPENVGYRPHIPSYPIRAVNFLGNGARNRSRDFGPPL